MRDSILPLAAAALVASAAPAFAQYSANPDSPLSIVATAGDDVQPKIARGPAGGQYISYFSGAGYDIFLDSRNAQGSQAWTGPVLVADRAFSSTTDYGMTSDPAGNAYVVYNAEDPNSTGGSLVRMASVAPDGTTRWNIVLYTAAVAATSLGNGRAVIGSDGFVWGAYSVGFDSVVARVNPATGTATGSLYVTATGFKSICSGLQPTTDGAVILSSINYGTFTGPKTLRARRINPDLTYGWGGAAGTAVFSTGSVQTGNFPDFIPDGAGGGYFPYYSTANPINCYVQRIDASGNLLFGANGVQVASVTSGTVGGSAVTLYRTNPSAVVGGDGRCYVFYRTYTSSVAGIVWYGIGAQCIDGAGNRLWGDAGAMVEDYVAASTGVMFDRNVGAACRFGPDAGCSYVDSTTALLGNAKACRMNSDGTTAWKVPFASNPGTKYRFGSSQGSADIAVFAWQGVPSGGSVSDIWAARVNSSGTVGNPPVVGDLTGDGYVNGLDLGILLSAWGPCGGCQSDLNLDGSVNGTDLGMLLANWTL